MEHWRIWGGHISTEGGFRKVDHMQALLSVLSESRVSNERFQNPSSTLYQYREQCDLMLRNSMQSALFRDVCFHLHAASTHHLGVPKTQRSMRRCSANTSSTSSSTVILWHGRIIDVFVSRIPTLATAMQKAVKSKCHRHDRRLWLQAILLHTHFPGLSTGQGPPCPFLLVPALPDL